MEKKYQIFISSTYNDLKEERKKVSDAILRMQHFPVGMEIFGANNNDSWSVITKTIDNTDYYILIIGDKYGSITKDDNGNLISFTEKEYKYAKSKNIPILAFIKACPALVNQEDVIKEHIQELVNFKSLVKKERNVAFWNNVDELVLNVTMSLASAFSQIERPGWTRLTENMKSNNGYMNNIGLIFNNTDKNDSKIEPETKYIDNENKLKEKFFQKAVDHKVEYFLCNCDPMSGFAAKDYDLFDASVEAMENLLYDAPLQKDSNTYKDILRFIDWSKQYSLYILQKCISNPNGNFLKFNQQELFKEENSVKNEMMIYRQKLLEIYLSIGQNNVSIVKA